MTNANPIEAFAIGLLPNAPEIVAVLYAYLDETGLNQNARSVTVAGLVAPIEQWVGIQSKWSERMRQSGISTFHAQPCRGGHKKYKSMPESERHKLYEDLALILAEYQPQAVAGSVNRRAWDLVKKGQIFSDRYPSAYSFCFDLCLSGIQNICDEMNREVIIIYAINEQYLQRAKLVAEVYEASQRYLKCVKVCRPNTPSVAVPLQAADMLAYEVYHYHQNVKTPPKFDLLRHLKYPFVAYEYDLPRLRRLIASGPNGIVE